MSGLRQLLVFRLRFVHPLEALCVTGAWLANTVDSYNSAIETLRRAYEDQSSCVAIPTETGPAHLPWGVLSAGVMFIDNQEWGGSDA